MNDASQHVDKKPKAFWRYADIVLFGLYFLVSFIVWDPAGWIAYRNGFGDTNIRWQIFMFLLFFWPMTFTL